MTSLTGLYHDWYLQVQRHFISAEGAAGPCRLVAYQECHRKGESSTQAVLQASTVSQYFGNPDDEDSVGLAEQLLMGTALFSGLFNKEELASTTTSPTTGAANATTTGSNVARLSTSASVVIRTQTRDALSWSRQENYCWRLLWNHIAPTSFRISEL